MGTMEERRSPTSRTGLRNHGDVNRPVLVLMDWISGRMIPPLRQPGNILSIIAAWVWREFHLAGLPPGSPGGGVVGYHRSGDWPCSMAPGAVWPGSRMPSIARTKLTGCRARCRPGSAMPRLVIAIAAAVTTSRSDPINMTDLADSLWVMY